MVNSKELIGTTVYLTLYTRCRINRCRYKRAAYEHNRMYYTKLTRWPTNTRANLLSVSVRVRVRARVCVRACVCVCL